MSGEWLNDRQATNAFLQFGFLPRESNIDPYIHDVNLQGPYSHDLKSLTNLGIQSLDAAFEQYLEAFDASTHIVPLSGGLDSRTILGELLERVGNEHIRTITFGLPGTWDYDIPRRIADRFDLNATFVPLDTETFQWSNELVFDHCDLCNPVPIIEKTVNHHTQHLCAGNDVVYWSGFNIETGAVSMRSFETWERAVTDFVSRNTVSSHLVEESFNPRTVIPDVPITKAEVIPFDQQLDYALRQEYYSKPLLIPDKNISLAMPFMEPPWREFCLNLELEYRKNRRMFKRILRRRYPDLFAFPVDSHSGLSLNAPATLVRLKGLGHSVIDRIPGPLRDPRRNYYDFDTFFDHQRIRGWIFANLKDLSTRPYVDWISPIQIWNRYRSGSGLGNEIRLLLSLELYFKMRERSSE